MTGRFPPSRSHTSPLCCMYIQLIHKSSSSGGLTLVSGICIDNLLICEHFLDIYTISYDRG